MDPIDENLLARANPTAMPDSHGLVATATVKPGAGNKPPLHEAVSPASKDPVGDLRHPKESPNDTIAWDYIDSPGWYGRRTPSAQPVHHRNSRLSLSDGFEEHEHGEDFRREEAAAISASESKAKADASVLPPTSMKAVPEVSKRVGIAVTAETSSCG